MAILLSRESSCYPSLFSVRLSAQRSVIRCSNSAPSQNPFEAGWELHGTPTFDGGWIEEGNPGRYCLVVRKGYWQTPPLEVEPFHYYRISFDSKTKSQAYWSVAFLDDKGQELAANVYDSIDASHNWQGSKFCFALTP